MNTDRSISLNNSVNYKAEINLENINSNFSSILLESEQEMVKNNNERDRIFNEENYLTMDEHRI